MEKEILNNIINEIENFKQLFGIEALEVAITYGAFSRHPEIPRLGEILKYRDVNEDFVRIPQWITDLFLEYGPEP